MSLMMKSRAVKNETQDRGRLREAGPNDVETEQSFPRRNRDKKTYASIEGAKSVSDGIVTTDVSAVVENCMPSIVAITGKSVEDIETYYYGTQEYEAESAASGIIIARTMTSC